MTYTLAIQKARRIAKEHGQAALVASADPAHGDGQGENRFDAVPFDIYERDRLNGHYLTLEELITEGGKGE